MIFNRRRGKKKKDQEDSNEQVDPNEAPEGDQDMEENPEGENPSGYFQHDPADYRSDSGYSKGPGRGRGGGQRGGYNNNRPRTGPTGPDAGWDKPEPGKDGASTDMVRLTRRVQPKRERLRRRLRHHTRKGSPSSSSR